MKLLILRHGEAEPFVQPDADRVLTVKGIHDAQCLGKKLHDESLKVDTIITSPYVRARQTLDSLKLKYETNANIITSSLITPNGSLKDIYGLLSGFDEDSCIMLVSHLPLVSILIAHLVTGSDTAMNQYPMSPASLAEIDLEHCAAGCGELKRLISPPYAA